MLQLEVIAMRNSEFISLVDIQRLPFFFGLLAKDQITKSDMPRFLPFRWGVDLSKGLFRQWPSSELSHVIDLAYMSPVTIAPSPGEGQFGKQWADTVTNALNEFISVESISGKSVLEIGCSNGLLLTHFASRGALCVGIEPGPQASICSQRPGVKVLRSYFEEIEMNEKFDFVYAINVLEHVLDLDRFFAKLGQVLKPGGKFFVAIPDSELDMTAVTPNLFVHEHYWYFTQGTIEHFLALKGLQEVKAFPSSFGSNFFVCGTWEGQTQRSTEHELDQINVQLLECGKVFARNLTSTLKRLQLKIDAFAAAGNVEIGLYGASNAINYLGLLDWKITPRVFDTDRSNHGKYLWSSSRSHLIVEAPIPEQLRSMEEIWVLPIAHQEQIRKYLLQVGVSNNRIANHMGTTLGPDLTDGVSSTRVLDVSTRSNTTGQAGGLRL